MNPTKAQLRSAGLKVSHFTRDLVVRAEAYLAQHREELIAEAKEVVERWQAQGFFGNVQDLRHLQRREGLKHRSFLRAEFQFKMRNGK